MDMMEKIKMKKKIIFNRDGEAPNYDFFFLFHSLYKCLTQISQLYWDQDLNYINQTVWLEVSI